MTEVILDVKLKSYSVFLREDGIIQVDIEPITEVTIEEVIQGTNEVMNIVGINKYPVLFLAKEFSVPSKESREYLAKKEALPYSLADAYVICSFPQKLVANFYLRINKPARPTRIFTDKNEAIKWLKTFFEATI
ncbi:MAG: hypothetical protein HYR91_04320 [Flavobacteriia bacterium]|nr:hypothetical protein [Flavobacteriia bacterium]